MTFPWNTFPHMYFRKRNAVKQENEEQTSYYRPPPEISLSFYRQQYGGLATGPWWLRTIGPATVNGIYMIKRWQFHLLDKNLPFSAEYCLRLLPTQSTCNLAWTPLLNHKHILLYGRIYNIQPLNVRFIKFMI